MKTFLAVLLALVLSVALSASAAADPIPLNGSVLVSCNRATPQPTFPDAVDPIVSYGIFPSAHDHGFWGSDQASPTTTLPKLLAGGTSCDVKSDKSLYWHPTIVAADGSKVYPNRSSFYYRAANRGVPITAFPPGIRFVSGNAHNLSGGSAAGRWQCAGESVRTTIPSSCLNGGGVQESVYVTPCWNGLDLGTGGGGTATNGGIMAGAPTGTDGKPHCPASHPINLPSLQYIINWPAKAVGGRLASDEPGAAPGASVHVDFFNGWTLNSQGKDALALIVEKCLNVDAQPGAVTCQVLNGQIVTYPGRVYVTD
jgi:hypothetical protein